MQSTNDTSDSVLIETYNTADTLNHLMECYIATTYEPRKLQNYHGYLKQVNTHNIKVLQPN
jgi:hypothetical protein